MDDKVVHLIERAAVRAGDTADLSRWLRTYAAAIDAGNFGQLETLVLLVEQKDGTIGRASSSVENVMPLDTYRLAGLLQAAGLDVLNHAPNFLSGG